MRAAAPAQTATARLKMAQSAIARISTSWQTQSAGQPQGTGQIQGTGQPQSAGQLRASWTVLDTGFGAATHFLQLLQCWRTQAEAPAMLHYVGALSAAQAAQLPTCLSEAGEAELAGHCHDLDAGFHRLLLEGGQVSLTLCVGETFALLARQQMQADSLLLASPDQPWDQWQLKAVARCCRRGAQLQFDGPLLPSHALLANVGFEATLHSPTTATSTITQVENLQATYNPRWQLRSSRAGVGSSEARGADSAALPGRCAVIGAGIAGASVARALALRGFQVDVYDAQAQPAGGASGLPLGLVVPHHSADDSPRSRMSRSGTRLMLQHASELLQAGQDWQPGGVLELCIDRDALADAEAEVLSAARAAQAATGWARPMVYGDAQGLWHPHAAWIKPGPLVLRWLDHVRIAFHGQAAVHALERQPDQWLLRDGTGVELGRADCVVFANAYGCVELVQRLANSRHGESAQQIRWVADGLGKLQAMQRMLGTLSSGPCTADLAHSDADARAPDTLPTFPVNGHGSFVNGVPTARGPHWYAGATFESDVGLHAQLDQEHAANFRKLQALLPAAAAAIAPQFAGQALEAWQGERCISHDRLPLVGPLEDATRPTLWLCAGMGARGLSFSVLCAELLVSRMCGEPLPLESKLARALDVRRPRRSQNTLQ